MLSPEENNGVQELSKMTNVGDPGEGETEKKSPGGFILSSSSMAPHLLEESDRLVVLKMSCVGPLPEVDENSLESLLARTQHLISPNADSAK